MSNRIKDVKKAIDLIDRASQYLPEKFTSSTHLIHRPRQDLLDCLDSVCAYLDVLEKEEEEE